MRPEISRLQNEFVVVVGKQRPSPESDPEAMGLLPTFQVHILMSEGVHPLICGLSSSAPIPPAPLVPSVWGWGVGNEETVRKLVALR